MIARMKTRTVEANHSRGGKLFLDWPARFGKTSILRPPQTACRRIRPLSALDAESYPTLDLMVGGIVEQCGPAFEGE